MQHVSNSLYGGGVSALLCVAKAISDWQLGFVCAMPGRVYTFV